MPTADQSNETIMPYVAQISLLLQQDYNIMATLLFLKYWANVDPCSDSPTPVASNAWAAILLPYDGFNDSNSAKENLANLDKAYGDFFEQLDAAATECLVSDDPSDPGTAGPYKNLKTWQGVSGGAWTSDCNLYVWSGSSLDANAAFSGSFDGETLASQCWVDTAKVIQPDPYGNLGGFDLYFEWPTFGPDLYHFFLTMRILALSPK